MLQIQHTVIVLLIIIAIYKINCASIVNEKEIGKLKLKIRDETVIENASLEARSRTKRWIKETIKTPSGASVSITSPEVPSENCSTNTTLIYLDKHGKMSYKEYALVSSEVDKSKENGCFIIRKIRKVKNECLLDNYQIRREIIMIETNDTNERLLFHGADNVWNITNNGFDERLVPAGTLFGAGISFTDSFAVADSKVIDKTCLSCNRKVLLSRVILGKQYNERGNSGIHAHAPIGHHSVLRTQFSTVHDEYIVYRRDQTYPEYVITYKTC